MNVSSLRAAFFVGPFLGLIFTPLEGFLEVDSDRCFPNIRAEAIEATDAGARSLSWETALASRCLVGLGSIGGKDVDPVGHEPNSGGHVPVEGQGSDIDGATIDVFGVHVHQIVTCRHFPSAPAIACEEIRSWDETVPSAFLFIIGASFTRNEPATGDIKTLQEIGAAVVVPIHLRHHKFRGGVEGAVGACKFGTKHVDTVGLMLDHVFAAGTGTG